VTSPFRDRLVAMAFDRSRRLGSHRTQRLTPARVKTRLLVTRLRVRHARCRARPAVEPPRLLGVGAVGATDPKRIVMQPWAVMMRMRR